MAIDPLPAGRRRSPYEMKSKQPRLKGPNSGLLEMIDRNCRKKKRTESTEKPACPGKSPLSRFEKLLKCDASSYQERDQFYICTVCEPYGAFFSANEKASLERPAEFLFVRSLTLDG